MRTQLAWALLAGLTVYSIFTIAYGPKLPRCEQRRQFLDSFPRGATVLCIRSDHIDSV